LNVIIKLEIKIDYYNQIINNSSFINAIFINFTLNITKLIKFYKTLIFISILYIGY